MKVKSLIKYLMKYNPDADIGLCVNGQYENDIYISFICRDTDGNKLNHQTTKQIWLEGMDFCVNCRYLVGDYCTAYCKDTVDVDECYHYEEIE